MKKIILFIALCFIFSASGDPVKDCRYKGIPLYGRVKIVTHHADFDIRIVENHADLHVKRVKDHPDECGLWQFVEDHPDFTVRIVEHHPDFTVKYVSHHPGMP
jgi:hypothetical protein